MLTFFNTLGRLTAVAKQPNMLRRHSVLTQRLSIEREV